MRVCTKPIQLKYTILAAGVLGLVLRTILYATGIDGRGLLEAGHWADIALWILTGGALAVLFFGTRPIASAVSQDDLPASPLRGIGAFAAAVGIGITTISEFATFSSRLMLISWLLGLCSAVSMALAGVAYLRGRKPHCLLHAVLCVYFALRMLSRYRMWSATPQLQDYCFYLVAYASLMLTAYHRAAFGAGMGSLRSLWFFSLGTVYLCCLSLKGAADYVLLLGCGIWAFAGLPAETGEGRAVQVPGDGSPAEG